MRKVFIGCISLLMLVLVRPWEGNASPATSLPHRSLNETGPSATTISLSNQEGVWEQIQKQAYARVSFSMGEDELKIAIESFKAFLALPDSIKNPPRSEQLAPDAPYASRTLGLVHRNKTSGKDDDKTFFHFHPTVFERYRNQISSEHAPAVENFLNHAHHIWEKVRDTMGPLLEQMEGGAQLAEKFRKTPDAQQAILLRFIAYDSRDLNDKLTRSHYDKSAFTLALWQDKSGLRIGKDEDTLALQPYHNQEAYFFLGTAASKHLVTDSPQGWHDAIQLEERRADMLPVVRWAIVAFIYQ